MMSSPPRVDDPVVAFGADQHPVAAVARDDVVAGAADGALHVGADGVAFARLAVVARLAVEVDNDGGRP